MAERQLIVRIIGDDKSLRNTFSTSTKSAKQFGGTMKGVEDDVTKASRGVAAGSGLFRSFGRSLAFASGGFLAFASAGQAVRKSIDAALEASVAQKQLAAQFKASGQSLSVFEKQIDDADSKLSLLSGFNGTELEQSFTTIFRVTGNVTKSLRDNATAADFARARHISLAQAALVVAKAEAGNTTLLRRAGFQIAKNATAEQALEVVRERVAGQAAAGATAQDRFGAVLHNTEVIIGTALLPTLNKYLIAGAKWLTQLNDSGKLQKDVSKASKDLADAFSGIHTAIEDVDKVTGGFKNTLELLLALKVGSTLSGWASSMGLFAGKTVAAEGAAVGLKGELAGLDAINPIVIPISLAFLADRTGHGDPLGIQNVHNDTDFVGILTGRKGFLYHLFAGDAKPTKVKLPIDISALGKNATSGLSKATDALQKAITKASNAQDVAVPKPLTATQKNTFFDNSITRLLDRSQDGGLNEQITKLRNISKLITDRIAVTKDITRKLHLEDELVGIGRTISSDQQQIAQNAAQRLQDQKTRLADAAAAKAARNQGSQFKALGLSAAGDQIIPVTVLKNELARVSKAVSGTLLDTSKTKSLFANIRKIFAGGFGAITKDTKSQIKTLLDGIDQQLKDHKNKNQTSFSHVASSAVLAGLGLSPEQTRALRERITQIGAGGTVPQRSQQFSLAGAGTVEIHLHGVQDVKALKVALQKEAKRRAPSRRN